VALLSARLNKGRLNAERLNWIPDTVPPTVPTNLAASATTAFNIALSWTAATDAAYSVKQYRIERCTGAGCVTFAQIATATGTTYNDATVAPLTAYRYRIRAEDTAGNLGGYSNIASVTTPAPPPPTSVSIKVGGVWTRIDDYAMVEGASITQALNEVPDTCSLRFKGAIPFALKGTEISVSDTLSGVVKFAGHITAVRTIYLGRARNLAYDCDCVDYTWPLNFKKVTKRYPAGTWSSTMITDLVTTFGPPGFSVQFAANTDVYLADEITFTNEDLAQAISRVCERGGRYWLVDYSKAVQVFTSAALGSAGTITQATKNATRDLAKHEDLSPVATTIDARGGGSPASIDCPVGQTSLPVDDPIWYAPGGGFVECGPQRLQYAGVSNPGTGALVGSGNSPSAAPSVAGASGSNLAVGAIYQYAVSFVTGSGETLAGPSRAYSPTGASIPPAPAPGVGTDLYDSGIGGGKMVPGGSYRWAWAKNISGGGLVPGTPTAGVTVNGNYWKNRIPSDLFNDANVSGITPYRTTNGGSTFYADYGTIYRGGMIGYLTTGDMTDGDLSQGPTMGGGGGTMLAATLSQIPVYGKAGVATARKIYRTVANGTQLKLLATINDNTTTTFLDTVADGALGANAPVTDTSGIQGGGQVNAGAPSLLVSNTSVFAPSGGWVAVSGLTLRYTSVSGGSLVLAAPLPSTLSYGSEVLNAPYLTGIPASGAGSIVYPIKGGDEVYVFTNRTDATAVTNLKTWLGYGDGYRFEFLTDGRLGLTELVARADALLAMRKDPLVTVTFETRDPAFTVGKTVTFNLTEPPITGTFLIQRVQIDDMPAKAHVKPIPSRRRIEASSRRYTFDDLVEQIKLLGRIN